MELMIAVIGDLRRPRAVPDRSRFDQRLRQLTARMRERQGCLLEAQGVDRVLGVGRSLRQVVSLTHDLALGVFPQALRFGVGLGSVDVGASSGDVNRMDGPALHQASDAAREAQRRRVSLVFQLGTAHEAMKAEIAAIETNLELLQCIRDGWNDRLLQISTKYEELGRQEDVAKDLGISQQAVSHALARGHHRPYRASLQSVQELMSRWDERLGL